MMRNRSFVVVAAVLLVAGLAAAQSSGRWINVNVDEVSSGTKVEVHLPLDLVLNVLDGVDVEHFHGGHVELETDVDVDWPKVLNAVKDAPDGEYVKVQGPDEDVQVMKKAGTLFIHVTGKGEDQEIVDVQVPASILTSLDIDGENRIDVKALLSSLATLPSGDLVKVTSNDANVRIWIE
jgi:hypothetical protein